MATVFWHPVRMPDEDQLFLRPRQRRPKTGGSGEAAVARPRPLSFDPTNDRNPPSRGRQLGTPTESPITAFWKIAIVRREFAISLTFANRPNRVFANCVDRINNVISNEKS
jgi:hypothetical protein